MQLHRRAAQSFWTHVTCIRMLIGEHDDRVTDLHLGMPDFPIRTGQAHQLSCTKPALVKLDCRGSVADGEIRRYAVIFCRNWFDLLLRCTHNSLLSLRIDR